MKNKKLYLTAILLLLFSVLYYGFMSDRLYPVVAGRIYRSAQLSAERLEKVIDRYHIKTIINLRGIHKEEKWYLLEKETAVKNKTAFYSISMPDHDLPKYRALNRLMDLLLTAERPLLIHCRRGADRAGMASALALIVEKDLTLAQAKKQFSWRYGVVPWLGSIGPRLFSEYEAWLADERQNHARGRLLYWTKHAYVDRHHNVEFWIDSVDDRPFSYGKDYKITVRKTLNPLSIKGWAYDAQKNAVPRDFFVVLGDRISARVNYKFPKPDVQAYLGMEAKGQGNLFLGWEVSISSDNLIEKCYPLAVGFVRDKPPHRTLPTKYQLCIK